MKRDAILRRDSLEVPAAAPITIANAASNGGPISNHGHTSAVGDGGRFDAAHLSSGTAHSGQVLAADGIGNTAWQTLPTVFTDWSYRSADRSTSAYAWKGNQFTPYVDLEIFALAYFGSLVAEAVYQAAVVTVDVDGKIDTITKSTTVQLPANPASPDDAVLWLCFSSPVDLAAGTAYYLFCGRTDGDDDYALPCPADGGTAAETAVPMPGSSHGACGYIAKANPVVGDTVETETSNSLGQGVKFCLA